MTEGPDSSAFPMELLRRPVDVDREVGKGENSKRSGSGDDISMTSSAGAGTSKEGDFDRLGGGEEKFNPRSISMSSESSISIRSIWLDVKLCTI